MRRTERQREQHKRELILIRFGGKPCEKGCNWIDPWCNVFCCIFISITVQENSMHHVFSPNFFDQRIFNTNSIYYSINCWSLSRGHHVIWIQLKCTIGYRFSITIDCYNAPFFVLLFVVNNIKPKNSLNCVIIIRAPHTQYIHTTKINTRSPRSQ